MLLEVRVCVPLGMRIHRINVDMTWVRGLLIWHLIILVWKEALIHYGIEYKNLRNFSNETWVDSIASRAPPFPPLSSLSPIHVPVPLEEANLECVQRLLGPSASSPVSQSGSASFFFSYVVLRCSSLLGFYFILGSNWVLPRETRESSFLKWITLQFTHIPNLVDWTGILLFSCK